MDHRYKQVAESLESAAKRYVQDRDFQDLSRVFAEAQRATRTFPESFPDLADFSNKLAITLGQLFEHTHELDVAGLAVSTAESAIREAETSDNANELALGSNTLARVLGRRFDQAGSRPDLERAIALLAESLSREHQGPEGLKHRVIGIGYLANLLGARFDQEGDVEDLQLAIRHSEEALKYPPIDPVKLITLANRLSQRAQSGKDVGDIDRAIVYGEQVLGLNARWHPDWATWLSDVGKFYGMRFHLGAKAPDDVRRGIDLTRQAAQATNPEDDVMLAFLANGLSNLLLEKYEQDAEGGEIGHVDDLDEAIDVLGNALAARGLEASNPLRGGLEYSFGDALYKRYLHAHNYKDWENAKSAFQRAWSCLTASPTVRIDAAGRVAGLLAGRAIERKARNATTTDTGPEDESLSLQDWEEASEYLDHAVGLLPVLSPRHLQNVNKQQLIKRFAGLGPSAAAAALNAKKGAGYALQQLELGRNIISGLLLDLRTDLSSLRNGGHPEWAAEFSRLRDLLNSGRDPLSPRTSPGEVRRRAEKGLEDLVARIRDTKGFDGFLLPLTNEQLMEVADPDPAVVVNVAPFRCDAFIVQKDGIRLLELPFLTMEDINARVKTLRDRPGSLPSTLEWLWDVIVHPVLDALGFNAHLGPDEGEWPHIWWIPIGPLSSLPLHAAGYHTRRSGETALDRVMSSYISSLKSLRAGRLQRIPTREGTGPINALLVSMKSTPNRPSLRYAEDEVTMLEKLCPSLNATAIRPPEQQKRRDQVLKGLKQCDIFHFAGHGTSDPSDPSRSALLLRDWERSPLTVEDLRNQNLQDKPPFLAYLSACSTGANEVVGLSDEGIHLGYACQLAGFRHVVGTLWTVSDPFCVQVAQKFYQTLCDEGMTDAAVHRGLHAALRELRDVQVATKKARGPELNADSVERVPSAAASAEASNGNDGGSRKGEGVPDVVEPSINSLWVPFVHFGV